MTAPQVRVREARPARAFDGTIVRLEVSDLDPRRREQIRRACVEEGLLDEDELLDLADWRMFAM